MATHGRIYLAGPMTGHPEHNFPAFHEAAKRLTEAGWQVINPADNFGGRTDLPRSSYLRADIALLIQCEAVAMLPGWEHSRGARLEYLLAHELGMCVIDARTLEPLPSVPVSVCVADQPANVETILDEAQRLTSGDRDAAYGPPAEDFLRTARIWSGVLAKKLKPDAQIAPMEVALCMIGVKLARQTNRHKRDNLVDIAGYARTAAMVAGEE